ncbi:phospholipase/carboxylesterase [Sarocladium strictum]
MSFPALLQAVTPANLDFASVLSIVVGTASSTLVLVAYRDYRAYVALGPHGLPDTFWGWYLQLKLSRKARKDIITPAPYDIDAVKAEMGPNATRRYLPTTEKGTSIPPRMGPRPHIPGFVAPQRQTTAQASPNTKAQMTSFLSHLVQENSTILQFENSELEGPVPAVQLRQSVGKRPEYLTQTKGEMAHIHPIDGSTHLVLSLRDSEDVIQRGWGQRHRLSGTLVGWSYTLVYAPRDEEELEVWKGIVVASVKYCCGEIASVKMPSQ